MVGLFERMLGKYQETDYVIKLKARFLLQVCIAAIIIIPLIIIYTAYLNLNNPVYGYTIGIKTLAPTAVAFVLVVIITVILIRGYFTPAAHMFFIMIQVVIWSVMIVDKSNPVARLDTIVILIAFLSMSPLVFSRFSFMIPAYSIVTFLLLVLFTTTHASEMNLTYPEMWDYIADTGAATAIIAIVSYNLFAINRTALRHSEESRARLARVNEELNATNEELEASNEEIEAAMEELTATNEEFEAQNRELLASQEIISESLEEKIVLIKEVHHRVKNNMQIVSSLLNLQSLGIEDPQVRKLIKDAISRIHSMALIHEKIYKADNFSRINMAAYITDLTNEIIQLYFQTPDTIQVTSRLEPIHLSVDQAVPCGILLNEILTNSIKHGCRDASNCRIELGMSISEGTVTMTIADSGPGIDPDIMGNAGRKTLGLQIIDALAMQLNAEIDINVDNGTRFTIRFTEKLV